MAGFLADHFLPLACLGENARQVTHRTRRHEQRGFTPENFGGAFLKFIDGGILDKDVVADLRIRHRTPHFR